MASKLVITYCSCITKYQMCHMPGQIGHLHVIVNGRRYDVAPCPRCKE